MERPTNHIYLSMNEHIARFYLELLKGYQDRQTEAGLAHDKGVTDDIRWLRAEMRLREWPEVAPEEEEDY